MPKVLKALLWIVGLLAVAFDVFVVWWIWVLSHGPVGGMCCGF